MVLDALWFADKSPGQAWAVLLDQGVDPAPKRRCTGRCASVGNQVNGAPKPCAGDHETGAGSDGPDQVWSWDITKLKGPVCGVDHRRYAIIDIFSRKVVPAEIWPTENGTLAKEFIQNADRRQPWHPTRAIYADRGTSTTSTPSPAARAARNRRIPLPATRAE